MTDQTRPSTGTAIALPNDSMQLMALARELATARLIPSHFQKSPADCWLVMAFCRNRNLDFLMVVGECSVVKGRLFFSGKLTAALLNTSGYLAERLNYEYEYVKGEGTGPIGKRPDEVVAVTVTGRLNSETSPRIVKVHLDQVRTPNDVWKTQPEQQLAYAGARIWGRRHMPEVLMGLLFEGETIDVTPVLDVTPITPKPALKAVEPPAKLPEAPKLAEPSPEKNAADDHIPSSDEYVQRWEILIENAVDPDKLLTQWKDEQLLRGEIDWPDSQIPPRLRDKVVAKRQALMGNG